MSSPSTRPPNPGDDAVSPIWLVVRFMVSAPLLPAGSDGERRAGLLGELELLTLQLPPVVQPDVPDRAEIIALRAAISQLITEITIGLADPPLSCAD